MIHKTFSPLPGHVRVVFTLPSYVWADRIYLVGDFNHGNSQKTPLTQERDGSWQVTLDLLTGQVYAFHYLVDGRRQTDCYADGFSESAHSAEQSIVETVLPLPAWQPSSETPEERVIPHNARGWLPVLSPATLACPAGPA